MRRSLLMLGAAGVAAAGTAAVLSTDSRRVVPTVSAPSTTVGGLAAGGLDGRALTSLLARAGRSPADVTVLLGSVRRAVPRAELGATVDVEATVARVMARSGVREGQARGAVDPVLRVDDAVLGTTARRLVQAASVPEGHGRLTYADGRLGLVPPSPGQKVAPGDVRRLLQEASLDLRSRVVVSVPASLVPAHIAGARAQDLLQAARGLTARPLVFTAAGRAAALTPQDLSRGLVLVPTGSAPGHDLRLSLSTVSRQRLAAYLAPALSRAPIEPTVAAPAARATLRGQGSVTWRPRRVSTLLGAAGDEGTQITMRAAGAALDSAVSRLRGPVNVATVPARPVTSDAAARSINAVLGTFTTPYRCCQPRVQNIMRIARTVDGTLIGQGQTFSLNGIVGKRTRAKGYVEAPFILDGELSKDVGGGVSQFATTTLNAAFFAGVRLDGFQPHSFYISRYPPGREATVNYPGIDLRWTNDTAGPVLVRASTTATSLTVTLYGSDDGRSVRAIVGPRRAVPGKDFRITVVREVQTPGQPAEAQRFTTTYDRKPAGE